MPRAAAAGQNGRVEIAEHIDALREQGDLLADAAERAGLDAAVPPCPP
jgi:transcription elongation GreA/GreB family factor